MENVDQNVSVLLDEDVPEGEPFYVSPCFYCGGDSMAWCIVTLRRVCKAHLSEEIMRKVEEASSSTLLTMLTVQERRAMRSKGYEVA